MSVAALPAVDAARHWRARWNDRWKQASPRTRTRIQVGAFCLVAIVAYHYSLSSLLQTLGLETPLAYVGLVPFIALGLAFIKSRPASPEPAIHDRQVDYIVGVPLLGSALAMEVLLPRRLSTLFWLWRLDLLSLPLFVAGAVCIIFGVRALWRQRLAISYLVLCWPLLYTGIFLGPLNAVTNLTLHALSFATHYIKVGHPVPGTAGSIFTVNHQGHSFQLSVVSACSGVNGMVGFLLVGTAFGAIVTGPRLRKVIWLALGIALLWLINVGRLLLIFFAGRTYGEHFAISVLHPFVGLITFNIGILAMLVMLRPAGLRIGNGPNVWRRVLPPTQAASSTSGGVAVPTVYGAIALVAAVGLVLGVSNSGLKVYNLVAQASGEPRLASYLRFPASPEGWAATFATEFTFAKPYFGQSSQWFRYTYSPSVGPTDLHASLPIVADVIDTNDLQSFSSYGVEACYKFHGFKIKSDTQVNLGGGIQGQALTYVTDGSDPADWSIVYWIWPVLTDGVTRYERVILYILGNNGVAVRAPGMSSDAVLDAARGGIVPTKISALQNFLVAFAHELIKQQAKVPQGSQLQQQRTLIKRLTPAELVQLAKERAKKGAPTTTSTSIGRVQPG